MWLVETNLAGKCVSSKANMNYSLSSAEAPRGWGGG